MDQRVSIYSNLAQSVAEQFCSFASVQAIALAGSQTTGTVDDRSDIDLYIYTTETIPLSSRIEIVKKMNPRHSELNLQFWDLGDAWIDADTGIEVDVMYWDKSWIEAQIDRVLVRHQATVGYSTCFWHTVLNSKLLFERNDWFTNLHSKCLQPYPDELRRAIVAKNHPILRNVMHSYYFQIKKAIERNDLLSVNHRVAALFASYFDVLFALNCIPNPGEKKILNFALERCSKVPAHLKIHVEEVLILATSTVERLPDKLDILLDALDKLLVKEGFDPATSMFAKNIS